MANSNPTAPPTTENARPRLPRVFVLGDSISIHYGPHLRQCLRGRADYSRKGDETGVACAAPDLDNPTGPNGGDSNRVLAYLRERRRLNPIRADLLLLNCGLHDIKRAPLDFALQVAPAAYEQNLRAILAEARAMGLAPVWVRTTPVIDALHNGRKKEKGFHRFAADMADYNAIADRVMTEAGVPSIDLHGFSAGFGPEAFEDHVHFTEPVRARQATFIADALGPLLEAVVAAGTTASAVRWET